VLIQGPLHQQIGAAMPQPMLPVDAPTTVDDTLQERLHQELQTGLLVVETPGLSGTVLPEELLEGVE